MLKSKQLLARRVEGKGHAVLRVEMNNCGGAPLRLKVQKIMAGFEITVALLSIRSSSLLIT